MNKEEIGSLKRYINSTGTKIYGTFKIETIANLIIFYERLQQENERLKEIEKEHQKINGELREVIKKAIEYIESNPLIMVGDYKYYVNDLLQMEEFSTELSFIRTLIKILNKSK